MKKKLFLYFLVASFIISIDQVTKFLIMGTDDVFYAGPFLRFEKIINRGITWGFFQNSGSVVYFSITALITFFCISLFFYSCIRLSTGKKIGAETLLLSGGISNLVDRFIHCGVIDFIAITFFGWEFPIFNLADCFIVIGAFSMFVQAIMESE